MKYYHYFLVPAMNSVFRVQEDCCFEQVVFDGPVKGVRAKNDEEEDAFNSYDLLCYTCNPNLQIIPIPGTLYDVVKTMVNERKAA